jgi:hypothetical protein
MAFFEQINLIDGTTLYRNTSVTTSFTSSAIDTTNYGSIIIEVDSTGGTVINAIIEGSNDGTDGWYPIMLNPSQDLAVTDLINVEGHYSFNCSSKYIRVNATQVSGTYSIFVVGRSGVAPSAADKLTAAFDPGTPLNVNVQGVLLDKNKAIVVSDGVQYPIKLGSSTGSIIIDCTGYNSFSYQNSATSGTCSLSYSNDGITFYVAYAFSQNYLQYGSSSLVAGYLWTGPIQSRYLKFTYSSGTNVNGVLILKSAQWTSLGYASYGQSINISAIGGGVVNPNISGTMPVIGPYQSNTQVSPSYPVLTGGIYYDGSSSSPFHKSIATDIQGRLLVSTGGYQIPGGNNQTTGSVVAISGSNPGANSVTAGTAIPGMGTPGSNPYNINTQFVQDVTQNEGQNLAELLAQVLLELKILNQQMYELPRLIASGQSSTDPPEMIRAEPSIFNI